MCLLVLFFFKKNFPSMVLNNIWNDFDEETITNAQHVLGIT